MTMSTSASPIVADSRSRVGLLVMDGLLIVLMSWLLYVVVADRSAAEASEEAGTVVESAEGTSADTGLEIDDAGLVEPTADGPSAPD
jgi:hypothetical protein